MTTPMQFPQRPGATVTPVVPPPPVPVEDYITKKEVAKRMRKPVRTVEAWMREGIIPFYKVKQACRFRWSEIQEHWAARYRVVLKRPLPPPVQPPTGNPTNAGRR